MVIICNSNYDADYLVRVETYNLATVSMFGKTSVTKIYFEYSNNFNNRTTRAHIL